MVMSIKVEKENRKWGREYEKVEGNSCNVKQDGQEICVGIWYLILKGEEGVLREVK